MRDYARYGVSMYIYYPEIHCPIPRVNAFVEYLQRWFDPCPMCSIDNLLGSINDLKSEVVEFLVGIQH